MTNSVIEFLKESNNIEGVWDDDSLAQALYAWNFIRKEDKLTVGVILKTHKILMLHQKIRPDEKGYFRKRPVWIGGKEAKSHWAIDVLIRNWVEAANEAKTEKDIQNSHIHYEAIHPFIDGNGRTGRLFMNWQHIKAGLPILIIKNAEKDKYYEWFESKKEK